MGYPLIVKVGRRLLEGHLFEVASREEGRLGVLPVGRVDGTCGGWFFCLRVCLQSAKVVVPTIQPDHLTFKRIDLLTNGIQVLIKHTQVKIRVVLDRRRPKIHFLWLAFQFPHE
jgi:hypothetical protein